MAVNDDEWKALRGHVSSGFSRPSTVWTELKFKLMFSGWNKKDFFFGHLVGSLLVSSVSCCNETQKQFRICSPRQFSGSEFTTYFFRLEVNFPDKQSMMHRCLLPIS